MERKKKEGERNVGMENGRKKKWEKEKKLTDTENRLVVTRGEGAVGRAKWIKGVNSMEMGGN